MPSEPPAPTQHFRSTAQRGLRIAAHLASTAANRIDGSGARFLDGDRTVEWAFCFARLAEGPGRTLDFGADISMLGLAAAMRGHDVVALDRMPSELQFQFPPVTHHSADILDLPLAEERFDQIINCSTVEHVGLSGRYDSTDSPDGDLRAMEILAAMLAPGGQMILTIPVGRDGVFSPYHRVYGRDRLPALLRPFSTLEEQWWLKDMAQRAWVPGNRERALDQPGSESAYALGLFVLARADQELSP